MQLTPLQQFVQEKILLAVHKGCTLEEAKYEELKEGCIVNKVEGKHDLGMRKVHSMAYRDDKPNKEHKELLTCYFTASGSISRKYESYEVKDIIGLPPTIARVLIALGSIGYVDTQLDTENMCEFLIFFNYSEEGIDRKLLNEDITDATFFDQSEETQKSIALLLGWNDET